MLVFLAIIFSFHAQQSHELHTSGAAGGAGGAGAAEGDGRVCKGLEYGPSHFSSAEISNIVLPEQHFEW